MKSKIKHSKYCTFDNEAVGIFVLMQIVAQLQSECIIPKFALLKCQNGAIHQQK